MFWVGYFIIFTCGIFGFYKLGVPISGAILLTVLCFVVAHTTVALLGGRVEQ